jgi:hypothetical protein
LFDTFPEKTFLSMPGFCVSIIRNELDCCQHLTKQAQGT